MGSGMFDGVGRTLLVLAVGGLIVAAFAGVGVEHLVSHIFVAWR
jgi:hypothetical protein